MAFLDFLSKDIGGYTPAADAYSTFNKPVTGITYGDIAGALMKQGKSPTTQGFGNIVAQQYGGQTQAMQNGIQPQQNSIQPLLYQQKSQNGLGTAVKALAAFYGIGL